MTVLHHFAGGSDGAVPSAPLVQAPDGNLYGTTSAGGGGLGCCGFGTVFRMTPAGVVTILRNLDASDGDYTAFGVDGLTLGSDGNLRTMRAGGKSGSAFRSHIFRITPDGIYTILHVIRDGFPVGALVEAADGSFYGTNKNDFRQTGASIFRITRDGVYNVVQALETGSAGSLMLASDGNLYGSLPGTAAHPAGELFRLRGVACAYNYTAAPSDVSAPGAGGAQVITVTTATGCTWTPASTVPWMTVLDGGQRTGSGTFAVVVAPKRGSGSRVGFLTAGTATLALSVTQTGGSGRPFDVERWNLDGDRRTDVAVWRPDSGTWFTLHSTRPGEWSSPTWGSGAMNDRPVPGDYDGDGRGDLAVWRPGTGVWYILTSRSSYTANLTVPWGTGAENDVPVPADYDGDGATDVAVWRPGTGTWYSEDIEQRLHKHLQRGLGSGFRR